jgi:hypothetical protein
VPLPPKAQPFGVLEPAPPTPALMEVVSTLLILAMFAARERVVLR